MRVLLDSHVVLWWLDDNPVLGARSRHHIEQADTAYVSVVTPWELGIKRALGKLTMPDGLTDVLTEAGFELLPVTAPHAERAPTLPSHHRDPFDRMLVAQAQVEALALITADRAFDAYDVTVVAAHS